MTMRRTALTRLLDVEYPFLQAGMPWISDPELVAAVSSAGGLELLQPTAGMAPDDDSLANLREALRSVKRLTSKSSGVTFYLANPHVKSLIDVAVEEGLRLAVTCGGIPALFTGYLKDRDIKVLHQVGLVRNARSAESQGVDAVIAEGYEGGGPRALNEVSTLVLVPQMVGTLSIPVIASGGIVDARGIAAALALGAQGVHMGTRFIATTQCKAHQNYKEAILAGIDAGTVVVGRYQYPTRLLRTDTALKCREDMPKKNEDPMSNWDSQLGIQAIRRAIIDGDSDNGPAYVGSGVGLISEILDAGEVVRGFAEQAERIIRGRR